MCQGIAEYAGHWYNPFTMAEMIKEGIIEDIDAYYWIYVVLMVLLFLFGTIYQCRTLKEVKRLEELKKNPPQNIGVVQERYERGIDYGNNMT